ncbi:histidine phosphatase superfamily [Pelagophyceae sp. CCMP2097]|nr:histidine phosphatase superfamily [Pelagophyceae sp. CCMP2097]
MRRGLCGALLFLAMRAEALASLKRVTFVRHGESVMNVALARKPWGSAGFADPDIRDAPLTPRGEAQAKALAARLAKGAALRDVDALVSSPLTRALQTAALVFGDARGLPAVATALAAERLYLSSDLGASRQDLEAMWPAWDFGAVSAGEWWYQPEDARAAEWRPPGDYVCPGEPVDAFCKRMDALIDWLKLRDEAHIALVCHWGVLDVITGESFENCEARTFLVDDLFVRRPAE